MNSWLSSSNVGDEPPLNTYPITGWPTPHGSSSSNSSNQLSPRRREHAVQPPRLTTALSGHQFQGLGLGLSAGYPPTPLSTTSLSSPFIQGQSPAVTTPGTATRGSSPMASRQYNVPYNPQDWGPVRGSPITTGHSPYSQTNTLRIIPHSRQSGSHSDMNLSPPPPPYSPPSQQQQPQSQPQQQSDHVNQGASARSSASPVPSYNVEPPVEYRQRPIPRSRPLSMVHVGDAGHNRHMSLPPPPPLPQGVSGSRSSSQSRADAQQDPSSLGMGSRHFSTASQNNYNNLANATQLDGMTRPASSRRAVSAGPVSSSAGSSRATSQSRSHSPAGPSWEPGMLLPPPPPGPPPSARSHSASGLSETSSIQNSPVPARRTRPPPVMGTGLGSIPPTPAGWVDEGPTETRPRSDRQPLNIDTTKAATSIRETNDSEFNDSSHRSAQNSPGIGLFRSPAIRDPSAKGIRERRIERRKGQSQVPDDFSAVSNNTNPWADALDQVRPSNLILDDSHDSPDNNARHRESTRFTPRSNASLGSDGQQTTTRSRASSTGLFSNRSNRSSFSTPRVEASPAGTSRPFAQTPPFSPDAEKGSRSFGKTATSQALPPKALPTPPLQISQDSRPPSRLTSSEERPVSHILHLPNDIVPMVAPLSPRQLQTQQTSSLDSVVNQDIGFIQDATQRHKVFIEKEARAANETEALRIFTEFIIVESQIRRERYSKVWSAGSFDLEEVRRKLFELPPEPTEASPAIPAPLSGRLARGTMPKLDTSQTRPETTWWNNYKPCLSPIASMSMSNDERSSRGRAPSRWWESKTGSSGEGGERKVQRSKRESKYMGLPLEAIQWGQEQSSDGADQSSYGLNSTGQYAVYGPDEYPPEKVGWHEQHEAPALPAYPSTMGHDGPARTREVQRMDISRLITLPPPYPRHHPAVNNSHPDLVSYRTLVRSITDLSEIKATRLRYKSEVERSLQAHQERVQEGRKQFKANIQSQIHQGSITFSEAAEAEAALIVEENRLERELAKRELDTYKESVLNPLQEILTDRINRATSCIDELSSKLFDDAQHETPDQTQEEGDEKPELLEKLTQLKWLFEAREQLHREMHDLVSDRDEKYKEIVLLPYKQKANEEKVRETNQFFIKDALDRRVNYEASALSRLESFLDVIEENVARGVEVQLSAFWDIAPSLLTLIQQIPENLHGIQIQIPANEYEENPSYYRHPLQYLYTLLSHAEKSSYQFIESQINLFCLLHGVKSAVMGTNCKLMEAERVCRGEGEGDVQREMQETRAGEERSLTNDLKDRVATVEGQWTEALGSQIQDLRERVKEQLVAEDGWEDLEQLEDA